MRTVSLWIAGRGGAGLGWLGRVGGRQRGGWVGAEWGGVVRQRGDGGGKTGLTDLPLRLICFWRAGAVREGKGSTWPRPLDPISFY